MNKYEPINENYEKKVEKIEKLNLVNGHNMMKSSLKFLILPEDRDSIFFVHQQFLD